MSCHVLCVCIFKRLKIRIDEHRLFRAIQFNLLKNIFCLSHHYKFSANTKPSKLKPVGISPIMQVFESSMKVTIHFAWKSNSIRALPFLFPNKILLFLLYLALQIKFYWKYCLKCLNNWSNLLEMEENQLHPYTYSLDKKEWLNICKLL